VTSQLAPKSTTIVQVPLQPIVTGGDGGPTQSDELLDQLRAPCPLFPKAVEAGGVGNPSFKVVDRIFALQHGMDARPSLWFKARPGVQPALVATEPNRYFVPPYVGHHGWVGVCLDAEVDWAEVSDLVKESYRMTAPKRLLALIGEV
jgi:predicted DNA-binding protein (MmcQ/YjbR family)